MSNNHAPSPPHVRVGRRIVYPRAFVCLSICLSGCPSQNVSNLVRLCRCFRQGQQIYITFGCNPRAQIMFGHFFRNFGVTSTPPPPFSVGRRFVYRRAFVCLSIRLSGCPSQNVSNLVRLCRCFVKVSRYA